MSTAVDDATIVDNNDEQLGEPDVSSSAESATSPQPFPFRAEQLPAGAYWFRSGSDGWDFHARRFRANGSTTSNKPDPHDPNENEDRLAYGQPMYAIADGTVYAAWRNAPNNPRPRQPHPGRESDPRTIPRTGNFLAVLGDDGNIIAYAHMAPGSIPSALCPFDDEFVADADDKVAIDDVPNSSAIVGTLIPTAERPRVKRGQFIGRVGNAGASSGPHVHNHMRGPDGEKIRFKMNRAWRSTKQEPDNWQKFDGEVLGADEGDVVVHASPLLRRGHADAGAFGRLAMHFTRTRRFVTALSDSAGDLKVITWGMTPPEEIVRRGDATAGGVSQISIAEPQSDVVVTAVRTNSGNLKLISWRIETNGDVTRLNEANAGKVRRIAMVTVKTGVVVTSVRTDSGKLKLIAWGVSPNGTIVRRGDANAGSVRSIRAAAAASVSDGLVTAVRLNDGQLKLIAWETSGNGATITRRGDATGEVVGDYAMVHRGTNAKFILTAARDANGKLLLQNWGISQGGDVVRELASARAGTVEEVDIAGLSRPNRTAVVACRTAQERLKLITWDISASGETLTRVAGALAGKASKISIEATSAGDRDFFVTSCETTAGKLRLINWEANL